MNQIKTALVSVSNKENLNTLAEYFKENNTRVVSTGGTYQALKDLGVEVVKVSEQTGFPEVMGGRVKTLHPKIHMALLARTDSVEDETLLQEYEVQKFDLLVVNLYPFLEKKSEGLDGQQLVEFIDVGGPSMIRAGAKNFSRLVTLTSPSDYELLKTDQIYNIETRKNLAGKAFKHLHDYDGAVANWLLGSEKDKTEKTLRYGENPHQQAIWKFDDATKGLHQAKILQGKELSFNNLVDLTGAVESLALFSGAESSRPTVVSVKHNNPCGIGQSDSISKAMEKSLAADPMSVFGGIVAMNKCLDEHSATQLSKIFLECVAAPSITEQAKEILSEKKNLRVLIWKDLEHGYRPIKDVKRVSGGIVEQDVDAPKVDPADWIKVTGEDPDEATLLAMDFAWKTVARLKSNAISICSDSQSLGLGMGQVNRVDAVKSAISRWRDFHPNHEGPVVLASDAFFPFPDSIELIARSGIKWVVQPGGSIKDKDVIAKASELGVTLFFTGKRHFLH